MTGGRFRYVVVGAGGVGGAAAVLLHRAGHEVRVVARGAHAAAIAADGLLLRTPVGEHRARVPVGGFDDLVIDRTRDVVLLAVKSQDTAVALAHIARAGGDGATIVCAQNGVANEPAAARITDRVGAALVWTPAVFLRPGVIESYASPLPALWILGAWPGGRSTAIDELGRDLEAAGIAAPVVDDVVRFKYAKLLDNLGNGVDALCDVGSEGIGDEWRAVLTALRAEGEACLRAADIGWAEREDIETLRKGRVDLHPIGAARRPGGSTWQSLERESPTLELDFLNGEICMVGAIVGVPAPHNRALLRAAAEVLRRGAGPRSVSYPAFRNYLAELA